MATNSQESTAGVTRDQFIRAARPLRVSTAALFAAHASWALAFEWLPTLPLLFVAVGVTLFTGIAMWKPGDDPPHLQSARHLAGFLVLIFGAFCTGLAVLRIRVDTTIVIMILVLIGSLWCVVSCYLHRAAVYLESVVLRSLATLSFGAPLMAAVLVDALLTGAGPSTPMHPILAVGLLVFGASWMLALVTGFIVSFRRKPAAFAAAVIDNRR